MIKNQINTLIIERLSNDGNGIGFVDGRAVFVAATAPGDEIDVRIVSVRPRYAFGIVERLRTPAETRIENDCPAFPRCGGCDFRHLDYQAELAAKREFVEAALRRIGKLDIPVCETRHAGCFARYRNKAQYPVAMVDGMLTTGFYARRSHRIVPAAECKLQPTILNEIARASCTLLSESGATAYDEATGKGLIRHIFLRQSSMDDSVMLCLVLNGDGWTGEDAFVRAVTDRFPAISTVLLNENRADTNVILGERCRTLTGNGMLADKLAGVPVRLSPLSFFQVNHAAATLLYHTIAELADPKPGDTLLDLYCGAGTIGLSMARQCGQLIGVESVPQAVSDARFNAAAMGLDNCTFLESDAGAAAAKLAANNTNIDIAVTDPPRKGCGAETIEALLKLAPRRIVMVSCDPATLARDLAALTAAGYRAGAAVPVDMFPRTRHVECVVPLLRE